MKKMVAWGMRAKVFGLLWITYFIALPLAFLPIFAHADITQGDISTQDTTSGNAWNIQLGQGYTGTASSLNLYWGASLTAILSGPVFDLEQFSDSAYTTLVGVCAFDEITATGTYATTTYALPRDASHDFGVGCALDPSNYVQIGMQSGVSGSNYFRFFGAAFAPPGVTVASSPGGAVAVPYYHVYGANSPGSQTGITYLSPADGSITASSTVAINIGYFDKSIDGQGFDTVGYTIYRIDQGYKLVSSGEEALIPDVAWSYQSTTTLSEGGAYQLQAYLKNSFTGLILFSGSDAVGADNLGDSRFAVVTNPFPGLIGASSTNPADLANLATSTCSIVSLVGCVQNALVWAFFPSSDLLNQIAGAGFALKNEVPFGYLFVNLDEIQAINASGTPAFVLATSSPLIIYIFSPLDTGLAGILALGFLVWLFLRVRAIEL